MLSTCDAGFYDVVVFLNKPGTLRYLVKRQLVAEVHPLNFSHPVHADRLMFSCSESEQKQLNA